MIVIIVIIIIINIIVIIIVIIITITIGVISCRFAKQHYFLCANILVFWFDNNTNKPPLVQMMTCRDTGDKPFHEVLCMCV